MRTGTELENEQLVKGTVTGCLSTRTGKKNAVSQMSDCY